jgi:hypothetical protein
METNYPYGRFKLKAYCQIESEEIIDLRDDKNMTENKWDLMTDDRKEEFLREWNEEIVQGIIEYWAVPEDENGEFELY